MSNRKGGPGGRKPKAGKNKQTKGGGGGGGNPSNSLPNGSFPPDEYHNMNLPCCRLLYEVVASELTAAGSDTQQQTARPASMLGHMIRNHLLEKRKNEIAAAESINPSGSSSSSSPNKKKKKPKKKKKKTNNSNANTPPNASNPTATTATKEDNNRSGQEADETDSTSAIASTVSQDSQAVSAPQTTSAATTTTTVSTRTTSASTVSSSVHTAASTTATTASTNTATDIVPLPSTTPVDLYLDRLQLSIQQQQQEEGDTEGKGPLIRELDAFLGYLNEKHNSGIIITQQELECAYQSVVCNVCRTALERAVQSLLSTKQPIVLGGISFQGNGVQTYHQPPQVHLHNNHNGLAIPIHNQRPNAPPPPAPTVDFDYVAMEEGSSPLGTLLEAKADLEGIPYFHPYVASAEQTNGTDGNNSKKQNKKGDDSQSKAAKNQMEWRFVSSSSSSPTAPSTPATEEGSPSTATNDQPQDSSSYITMQDLEHLVKNIMLPMALPPDELLGTASDLSKEDVASMQHKVQKLETDFSREIHVINHDFQTYKEKYEELRENDERNDKDLAITYVNLYHDIDEVMYKLLDDVVIELVWDRLLWLHGTNPEMTVVRHTPTWDTMVKTLTDQCIETILEMMRTVEIYETKLHDEISNSQGMFHTLVVHKGHRTAFLSMIETKLRLVYSLFRLVQKESEDLVEAWPPVTGGRGIHSQDQKLTYCTSGLVLYFRRKWFIEQEFYRRHEEARQREEAAATNNNNNKRGSSSPTRAKKDSLQSQNQTGRASAGLYEGVNRNWFLQLASSGGDLLRGLIELSKTVKQGRIADLQEEQMMRCEKTMGLLRRVGEACVMPVVEGNEKVTGYTITDAKLLADCRGLWAQIQELRTLQQQEHLLAPNGDGPSISEHRKTVAELTVSLVHLLREIRKHVAANCGPKDTPMLPFSVIAWLSNAHDLPNGIDYLKVDMSNASYDTLVCMASHANGGLHQCDGGNAQPRLSSLFLALFYKKLAQQCSQWHAELAEQELLTTMTNSFSGSASGEQNSSGSKKENTANQNGVNTNASNTTTPGKKKRKKKKPSAAEPEEEKPGSGNPIGENHDDQGGVTKSMNGHQSTMSEGRGEHSVNEAGENNAFEGRSGGAKMPRQLQGADMDLSTVRVDKNMGVVEPSGTVLTAESYLVGRLTAILNGSGSSTKAQGSVPIVII